MYYTEIQEGSGLKENELTEENERKTTKINPHTFSVHICLMMGCFHTVQRQNTRVRVKYSMFALT